jgi:hypothetical protein
MVGLYQEVLGDPAADIKLEPPMAPQVPPPVAIGKTIVIDLQSSWWKRWVRMRRTADAFANDYRQLIAAETSAIVKEIEDQQVVNVTEALRVVLGEFLEDHGEALEDIAEAGSVDKENLMAAIGDKERMVKAAAFDAALAALEGNGRRASAAGA